LVGWWQFDSEQILFEAAYLRFADTRKAREYTMRGETITAGIILADNKREHLSKVDIKVQKAPLKPIE
jgi:hypothetical protein